MSVRARGPAPVLQTANAAGSRLEAVLAAGMARMALVPTDGLKRGASDITSDDAGLAFPLGEQLERVEQEKEAREKEFYHGRSWWSRCELLESWMDGPGTRGPLHGLNITGSFLHGFLPTAVCTPVGTDRNGE